MGAGEQLAIALVGTGWAAEMHAAAARRLRHARVRVVLSRTAERARDFAERFDIPECVCSPELLPPPEQCPLVIVTLPPHVSLEAACGLLGRGYFVLLEKPGAPDAASFSALAARLGPDQLSRLAVGYQLPCDRRFGLARRLSGRGCIGTVRRAYLRMYMPTAGWTDGRRRWALGPSAPSVWLEAGVHLIALACRLFGEPRVVAAAHVRQQGQCVAGTALLSHPDGVQSTLDVSFLGGVENCRGGLELQGSAGTLSVYRGSYRDKRSRLLVEAGPRPPRLSGPAPEDGTANLLSRLVASIRTQGRMAGRDVTTYEQALKILTLAESIELA